MCSIYMMVFGNKETHENNKQSNKQVISPDQYTSTYVCRVVLVHIYTLSKQ